MEKTFTKDFTRGPILMPLIKFGLPLFFANLLQIVYNMVDMAIVGNVCGPTGLSGVSIGGSVTDFFTVLVIGFSNAAQVIIAQFLGARLKEKIGSFIGTFSITLFIAAILNTGIALILRSRLLEWMNTPPEAFPEALNYTVMAMSGIIFVYGYNAVSSIMRGLGDSKRPFIFIAIAAVLNVGLDLLFVAVFGLGAFGAALATVISQAVSFLCALIYLARNKERLGFTMTRSDLRIDKELFFTLIKLGIPMALRSAAVSFSKLLTNSFVNSYGLAVATVSGIGVKLNQIGNLVANSLNTAGSTMVGQNIGAETYNRVPKIMLSVWGVNLSIISVLAATLIIFPRFVFGIFTSDESIMTVAMEFVPVAVLAFYACGLRSGANALTNGSGNFGVNLAVALLDAIVVRIGLSLLLGLVFGMGYKGFWYGDACSAFMPFLIGGIFYLTGAWKTNKHIVKNKR